MDDEATRYQDELARHGFLHQTLYELVTTLGKARSASDVASAFLPCVMGPLGATSGFVLLRGGPDKDCRVLFRGLKGEDEHLREGCIELLDKIFLPGIVARQSEPVPVILHGAHLSREFLLPPGTLVVMGVNVAEDLRAVVGFGSRLSGGDYDEEELRLLESATRHLATALARAHQEDRVTRLNADLERQNERLARSLGRMEEASDRLARQSYRMETLYASAMELSAASNVSALVDAFLLQCLGALATAGGYAALFDDRLESPSFTARGLSQEDQARLASKEGRTALLGLFVALKDRLPRQMESRLVEDRMTLAAAPGSPTLAVLFAVDESFRGLLCLGRRLTGEPLDEEERHLLTSLTTTFLVCLGRVRAYEELRRLNEDLAERNEILRQTIADLKSARAQIDLLSEARDRVVAMVRSGLSRADRLSVLDLCAIFLISGALALLFNFANPGGIPILPSLLFEEPPPALFAPQAAASLKADGAVLLDARPEEFFRERRLGGAMNAPATLFDFVYAMRLAELDPERPIIVYGRTVSMRYDAEVASRLAGLGHARVFVLDGDFPDWASAGLTVEEGL